MQPTPELPLSTSNSPTNVVPPPRPDPPPLAHVTPPLEPKPQSTFLRQPLVVLLSLCLGCFLADAAISLLDDTLRLFFQVQILSGLRGIVFVATLLLALVTYGLMGLTPMIPKRLFLPVTLFNPVVMLVFIPVTICCYHRIQLVSWCLSLCQIVFGLGILCWLQGGLTFRWPLVAPQHLGARGFSWRNLAGFCVVNLLVVPPVAVASLALCAALAIDHFSEGFVALRPGGLTVQARKYVRADGKVVRLIPMAHVGVADFYQQLAQSFPSNSIILMEGVTDTQNLITNEVRYDRMAKALGVAEQEEAFAPAQGEIVMADVDVEAFSTNTLGLLNLVMLIHAQGINADTIGKLMQSSPPPGLEQQFVDGLFQDLLRLRNRHLLETLKTHLSESEIFIVPWGAAHMPEIAREIQKLGFRLAETQDYTVLRFHSGNPKPKGTGKERAAEKPN